MIYRLLAIVKRLVFGFFRIICCILKCGRRKKVQVDDSLPTDIVIGDAIKSNYPIASALSNGYEVTSPGYYDELHEPRHPYQSQAVATDAEQRVNQTSDVQMQSWDQWGYEDTSTTQQNGNGSQEIIMEGKDETSQEEDIDFFVDMEPSVKVKKIFVKKKQKTESEGGNRFAVDQGVYFRTSDEFDDNWVEDDKGEGWADEDADLDEIDTAKVAREAQQLRKQERMQKSEEQKRLKLAKKPTQHRGHRLGTKVP